MMSSQPRSPTTVAEARKESRPSKGMVKNAIPASPTSPQRVKSSESSVAPPSTKQSTLLLLLLASGVGALGGFSIFYSMYKSQCARLLTSSSREYNATIEKLQSVDDRKTLTRQQGLLDQQAALASQHQELLVRLSNVQAEHEKSKSYIEHQKDELSTVQRALKEADVNIRKSGEQAKKTQERMQRQIDLARTMLQEKVDEVEELKEKVDQQQNCGNSELPAPDSNEEVVHMQSEIRRRDSIQTLSKFGLLPITVLFLVKSPSQAAISFEVQFDSVREMPHTIFTFFTLVDAGLYLETTLTRSDDNRLSGGSPSTCVRKQAQSKLVRRMAELGFGMEPALFAERSTKSCNAGSFGWTHKGPGFQVHFADAPEEFTCPGKIVTGLQELRSLPPNDRITIVDARIVRSTGNEDEL